MPENWYEDEEAVLRLSAIAASLKGEALSEEAGLGALGGRRQCQPGDPRGLYRQLCGFGGGRL